MFWYSQGAEAFAGLDRARFAAEYDRYIAAVAGRGGPQLDAGYLQQAVIDLTDGSRLPTKLRDFDHDTDINADP